MAVDVKCGSCGKVFSATARKTRALGLVDVSDVNIGEDCPDEECGGPLAVIKVHRNDPPYPWG